ncbi:DUF971 domain-containing protein [Cupriavidus neocaledonicus]|uniref:Gamma-butyrobetaine hydroxylase-like N-terminal domain-containing protein n=1 Tax=Cupriavidus neocaledonicus TaxID=1040979 RepID=A0A375HPH1_9BURK|nr:DUF971 domain-containing protein [Cupriavidus neocaledonicus]SOZ39398.1 conserved hypothetical protein [Cupriavidus neocaledonicus]SPD58886.1 conserved protein of unknown function [Cupriavidus neocaledonicus]
MLVPSRLELAPAEGVLRIDWPDGRRQSLDHARLRQACRCAACRSGPAGAAVGQALDQAVRIVAVQDMGYGIQLIFNDGHDRGIYPWRYLETL